MFNLESFSSDSHLPAPKYICNPCRYCPSPTNWLLVALGTPTSSHPLPQIWCGLPKPACHLESLTSLHIAHKQIWSFSFSIKGGFKNSKTNVRRLGVYIIWWVFLLRFPCPHAFCCSLLYFIFHWPSIWYFAGSAFVGPCPHRDRDYHIWSNFWKFYLIKLVSH